MTALPGLKIFKALADETRLRAAAALLTHELCVCQIVEMLELASSTVSKHLAILHDAGIVHSRKKGRWVFYRLVDTHIPPLRAKTIGSILKSVSDSPRGQADARRLRDILKIDPEILCERHRSC